MFRRLVLVCCLPLTLAADPPKAEDKIAPGKAVVPTKMRRIWGELVSLDLKTRTGTFRNESTDEVMPFVVLPYAELLHHAAFGDLPDFRIGERAIFRLHENEEGKWLWLTYIQDEMNFLNYHKEYYWVDRVGPAKGRIECTQANADKSFVRTKGLLLETDKNTRFWKEGRAATFADIQVGDRLRTKTHGVGKGQVRVCWEVFLDDASLARFQTEQQAILRKRMTEEGLPGYIDTVEGELCRLTLFQEAREGARDLRAGTRVRLAPAGVDRKAADVRLEGAVTAVQAQGALTRVTVRLTGKADPLRPAGVVRLWPQP